MPLLHKCGLSRTTGAKEYTLNMALVEHAALNKPIVTQTRAHHDCTLV